MIQASIDMREPNRSMKPSCCVQAPKIGDFVYHLRDCMIFTKLDLRQGYHQINLHYTPTLDKIATSSTPWGNCRPRRLIFGAKSSQGMFDAAVFRIFGNIPHCMYPTAR